MKNFTNLFLALLVTFFVTPLTFQGQTSCPTPLDSDLDSYIGVNDLLALLGLFGETDSDGDGVWDAADNCVDVSACNFTANPSTPCVYLDAIGICGGVCADDSDGDGICDDVDTCVGILDECGICNGPGPSTITIASVTTLYDSVYAEAINYWFVFEVGADTVLNYVCDPVFATCGDLVTHDGYDYSTVQIGEQCWFSENCRYLPNVTPFSSSSPTNPLYYVYDYNGTEIVAAQATTNYSIYGALYNWPAVMDPGICPSGWHIPSDLEWLQLSDFLGGTLVAGGKMKTTGTIEAGDGLWPSPNTGASNSSGFTGLPGGFVNSGAFFNGGYLGYFWSSSASSSSSAGSWTLYFNSMSFDWYNTDRVRGFSARCVMD